MTDKDRFGSFGLTTVGYRGYPDPGIPSCASEWIAGRFFLEVCIRVIRAIRGWLMILKETTNDTNITNFKTILPSQKCS